MERWQFYTVMSNGGQSVRPSWTWRTVSENGKAIRQCERQFARLDECVNDALQHGYTPPPAGAHAHPITPAPLGDGGAGTL
ncbi:MAG TPA: hypothetical protein VLN59_00475 [Burkholderiales bacterium]|nr:hypothetical protein [Burkholderiales bacterium]